MKSLFSSILMIFFLALITSQVFAQGIVWSHHVGGYGADFGGCSVIDNSGNIYFSGGFNGNKCYFQTDTLEQWGSNGLFIVKYNFDGEEVWVKVY